MSTPSDLKGLQMAAGWLVKHGNLARAVLNVIDENDASGPTWEDLREDISLARYVFRESTALNRSAMEALLQEGTRYPDGLQKCILEALLLVSHRVKMYCEVQLDGYDYVTSGGRPPQLSR